MGMQLHDIDILVSILEFDIKTILILPEILFVFALTLLSIPYIRLIARVELSCRMTDCGPERLALTDVEQTELKLTRHLVSRAKNGSLRKARQGRFMIALPQSSR